MVSNHFCRAVTEEVLFGGGVIIPKRFRDRFGEKMEHPRIVSLRVKGHPPFDVLLLVHGDNLCLEGLGF